MPRLNQILGIEAGLKKKAGELLTKNHHTLQKPALLSGLSRTYTPLEENGDTQPSEYTQVQVTANDLIQETVETLTDLFNATMSKELANTKARADIVVDGETIMKDVPAPYLLFLERQLVDLVTFIKKIPILDPAEQWEYDSTNGLMRTAATEANRTKKVLRNHVKAEATDKHPAQVDTYTEDIPVGKWRQVKYSGALPQTRVKELVDRVTKVQQAVLVAREEANMTEATREDVGAGFFNYIFRSDVIASG